MPQFNEQYGARTGSVSRLPPQAALSPKNRYLLVGISVAAAVIAILLFMYFATNIFYERCAAEHCFIQRATNCERSVYAVNDGGTVYEFKSFWDCTFKKTVKSVSEYEPEQIKEMFEGKSMECRYSKGNFDEKWLSTLLGGLEKCSGPLKQSLYELVVTQYQMDLGE